MPGANCLIFGCSTSRRTPGIGIFKLPSGNDEESTRICEEWIKVVCWNREVDADLKRQIKECWIHICENHFEKRFIEMCKYKLHCFYPTVSACRGLTPIGNLHFSRSSVHVFRDNLPFLRRHIKCF